jgi:hypothetical protein
MHPVVAIGPVQKVLDVIQRAAPAAHAIDVPVRVFKQKISEMGADHSGDSGNKSFHKARFFCRK